MKIKLIGLIIVLLCEGISAGLTIHLPKEATVETETLKLGQIAEVTGEEAIAAKARAVELGRISLPGQKVTIERSMVASRLVCSGITTGDCVLSGADKVVVSRRTSVIKSSSFIESAETFLADNIREQSIAKWEPMRLPAELVLSNQAYNIELSPRLFSRGTNGQANIEVIVIADGRTAGTRQIAFRPKYNTRRVVTMTEMAAGQTLTAENTRIEKILTDEPEPADWALPYGLVAARNLPEGTVITQGMVKTPKQPVVIERNHNVVIRIDRAGLVVTATGKAMQQGKLGENIKVRNIDSQRVILAKVNADGTVEPVY